MSIDLVFLIQPDFDFHGSVQGVVKIDGAEKTSPKNMVDILSIFLKQEQHRTFVDTIVLLDPASLQSPCPGRLWFFEIDWCKEEAKKDISRSSIGFVKEERRNIYATREDSEIGQTSVFNEPRVICNRERLFGRDEAEKTS
jgi:hypothetical protein